MTPTTTIAILGDPRWEDDPIALYDAVVVAVGPDEAVRVWKQACREADAAAEEEAAELEIEAHAEKIREALHSMKKHIPLRLRGVSAEEDPTHPQSQYDFALVAVDWLVGRAREGVE